MARAYSVVGTTYTTTSYDRTKKKINKNKLEQQPITHVFNTFKWVTQFGLWAQRESKSREKEKKSKIKYHRAQIKQIVNLSFSICFKSIFSWRKQYTSDVNSQLTTFDVVSLFDIFRYSFFIFDLFDQNSMIIWLDPCVCQWRRRHFSNAIDVTSSICNSIWIANICN